MRKMHFVFPEDMKEMVDFYLNLYKTPLSASAAYARRLAHISTFWGWNTTAGWYQRWFLQAIFEYKLVC